MVSYWNRIVCVYLCFLLHTYAFLCYCFNALQDESIIIKTIEKEYKQLHETIASRQGHKKIYKHKMLTIKY